MNLCSKRLIRPVNFRNRDSSIYWIEAPLNYETNQELPLTQFKATFYNAKNIQDCLIVFGRTATSLRLTIRLLIGEVGEGLPNHSQKVKDLEQVICSHKECLDELAKEALRKIGVQV